MGIVERMAVPMRPRLERRELRDVALGQFVLLTESANQGTSTLSLGLRTQTPVEGQDPVDGLIHLESGKFEWLAPKSLLTVVDSCELVPDISKATIRNPRSGDLILYAAAPQIYVTELHNGAHGVFDLKTGVAVGHHVLGAHVVMQWSVIDVLERTIFRFEPDTGGAWAFGSL